MRPLTAEEMATADAYASAVARHMRELRRRAVAEMADWSVQFTKESKALADELKDIARQAESDAASAGAGSGPADLAATERLQGEVEVRLAAHAALVAKTAELSRIEQSYRRF